MPQLGWSFEAQNIVYCINLPNQYPLSLPEDASVSFTPVQEFMLLYIRSSRLCCCQGVSSSSITHFSVQGDRILPSEQLTELIQLGASGPLLANGTGERERAFSSWLGGGGSRISPFGSHLQLDQIMYNVKPHS